MRKILYLLLLMLIINFIFAGCSENDGTKSDSFEIFLVKDLSAHDAAKADIEELILEGEPIITLKDITKYYWHNQSFIVNKEGLYDKLRKTTKMSGMPFVVIVNNERIYLGTFWTLFSSAVPPETPVICIDGIWPDELEKSKKGGYLNEPGKKEMYFMFDTRFGSSKVIKDKRIYDVMKKAGVLLETVTIEPKAVYFTSKDEMQLAMDDLVKYPEVIVTDSFDKLKSLVEKRIAIWIDKSAIEKIEQDWLQKEPQKKYPIVLVGYNDALYSFREKLGGFGIHGPKIDWETKVLEPGFSVWKLKDETGTSKSSYMKGYNITPSVKNILDVTNMLLEDKNPDEEKIIDLYVTVMKAAFQEENGGNGYIAVKIETLEGLETEKAREKVLEKLKDLSPNVYDFEEIKNDSTKLKTEKDGNLISTINGTILSIELEEYKDNEAAIRATSWFGNLGAVFPEYKATYLNGIWQLELIRMAVS